jgi:hypothetical protein
MGQMGGGGGFGGKGIKNMGAVWLNRKKCGQDQGTNGSESGQHVWT